MKPAAGMTAGEIAKDAPLGVRKLPGIGPRRALGFAMCLALVAMAADDPSIDVFAVCDEMAARGWYVQAQLSYRGLPASIHLTVTAAVLLGTLLLTAFDGTHPTLRQSPPIRCRSTSATFAPSPTRKEGCSRPPAPART